MQPLEEPVVGNFSPNLFGFAIIEPAIGHIFVGSFLDQTCQLDVVMITLGGKAEGLSFLRTTMLWSRHAR